MSKIALITGGSGGIGQACTEVLARQGVIVYSTGRSPERLNQVQQVFAAQNLPIEWRRLDVTQAEDIERVFAEISAKHQRLDIFIHAAGQGGMSILESPENLQVWQSILNTHLTGGYTCARQAALLMKPHYWGRIVFMASVLGLRGMRHSSAYCAAKHGLIGLTRALAQDLLEWGITVNALCPGWVETPMAKADLAEMAEYYGLGAAEFENAEIQAIPLGRWIQPQEVAALVSYLVSDAAVAVTGQALEISGGL